MQKVNDQVNEEQNLGVQTGEVSKDNLLKADITTRKERIIARAEVDEAIYQAGYLDGILKAADTVPTSWLDSLLTGARAVIGKPPYGCPEIEQLLRAVKGTIAALASKPVTSEQKGFETNANRSS